jgi:hypothetical protein
MGANRPLHVVVSSRDASPFCRRVSVANPLQIGHSALVDGPRQDDRVLKATQTPTWVRKLFYLGGRAAAGEHRDWIQGVLDLPSRQLLGFLLALPNALILVAVGLLSVAISDTRGFLIFFGGAVLVFATGLVPAVTRIRARRIASKNGLRQA